MGMKIKTDKLDILFSQYIRLRADNHCEYCGHWHLLGRLQTSHFIGRRNRQVRYDEDNAIAACFSCHNYLGEHPFEHTEFFRKRLGSEKFEQLIMRSNVIRKIDKDAIKLELKEKLKGFKDEEKLNGNIR